MAENEKKTETQKAPKETNPSACKRLCTWFKSLKSECKKISWASWKSVRSNSIIVIVCVIIFSAVLAILDLAFNGAISGLSRIF